MKGVYYRGKKFPFKYDNPNTGEVVLDTRDVIWLEDGAVDFLIETSPSDFVLAEEKEENKLGLKGIVCRKCGHVSLGRSEAAKHSHQCKGIADGNGFDGTDTA